ncbi:MAG TPA: ABC transporter permease [Thermomicrobiales bacterium]|nr:ABC transporter permease [Thermomicrobiales bacterium]
MSTIDGRLATPVDSRETDFDEPVAKQEILVASQWRLMWLKFRRHHLAMIGMVGVALLYLMAVFNAFLSPYTPEHRTQYPFAAPNGLHLFRDGRLDPYVYGLTLKADPATMSRTIVQDKEQTFDVNFFARGPKYNLFGLIPTNIRLMQVEEGGVLVPFGTDSLGRDIFSRALNGATISLSVGLVGVAISFFLGAIIGGFSGFYGGAFDNIVQRLIEFLIAIPTIPLWLALSAAIPVGWSPLQVYFVISLILSVQGWTGMARVVRGKLIQLREEDFVLDAQLAGASDWRIVVRHMLPAFASYLIVNLTLAIPFMILGETALSFLGLGLRPPIVSWGVLLQEAQNVQAILLYPWLLIPGLFVVATVLAFSFFGDGLRDAADPYAK